MATKAHLRRYARALQTLAPDHGLSNLRLAGDGQIIADIADDRTYVDAARFELAAEAVLRARVNVILSGTEFATTADKGPLTAPTAA